MTVLIVLLVILAAIATALVRHRLHLRDQRVNDEARKEQVKLAQNAAARR